VLEARVKERDAAAQAAYTAAQAEREGQAKRRGKTRSGRPPKPPGAPGPQPCDQYNLTDPASRVMKNPTDAGFSQAYNGQVRTDQASLLIVGQAVSNHPTDVTEMRPARDTVPAALDIAAAYDTGLFSAANIAEVERRGIAPYIATGRGGHRRDWAQQFEPAAAEEPGSERPCASGWGTNCARSWGN
jgi:hypothetical protein